MSNPVGTFWSAVNTALTTQAAALGVVAVERGESGRGKTIKSPGILTWLDLEQVQINTHAGKPKSLSVKLYVYCIAGGKATGELATDDAIEIAFAVASAMGGATVDSTVLELADSPFDIVDVSANRPVVSVSFDCVVPL